jgi:hypothetical protein
MFKGLLIAATLFVLILILALLEYKKGNFYQYLAQKYNLSYKKTPQIDLMQSFRSRLFDYSRTIATKGVLEGHYKDHIFTIFSVLFYLQGNHIFSKQLTVGSCEFGKTEFPYILLRSKRMPLYQQESIDDIKISIEKKYLTNFDLYCSENYEIEILQIFTEDLLSSISSVSKEFSIEFGGNRFYIYMNRNLNDRGDEKDIKQIIQIIHEIIDKTDGLLFRLKDDFEVLDAYYKT